MGKEALSEVGFDYVLVKDEDGWFVGFVPALSSCIAAARTVEDLEVNLIEAVSFHLKHLGNSHRRAEFLGVKRITL